MNNEKTIIAIDPGKNGGFAIRCNEHIECYKMPETPKDIHTILKLFGPEDLPFITNVKVICYLEKVHGMPGQGGQAMFTFGCGYGWIEMALLALEIPTETISPQKWQKPLSLGTKSSCASTTEWKNKLKAKAQQLFPNIKVTLWNADALLILHYALNNVR